MVCGSSKARQQFQLVDTSCAMKDVLQGKYLPLATQDMTQVQSEPLIRRQTCGNEVEEALSIISVRAARWMYRVQFDASQQALPPAPESFEMRSGRVFSWESSVLSFTVADSSVQEQRGMLLVTVSLPNADPLKVLVVAYRGTARLQDWMGNISPLVNDDPFSRYGISVHAAWHAMVAPRRKQTDIWKVVQDVTNLGVTRLIFTGHSMGGALAQIVMMQTLCRLDELKISLGESHPATVALLQKAQCITFAAPMPFVTAEEADLEIESLRHQRRALNWMSNNGVNYVNNNDVVARLPGCLDFLREVLVTVRPHSVALKLGKCFLNGAPVLRRYRPITRTSMIGHIDVAEGHTRLDMQPWDPEASRALCTRHSVDDWHDRCPVRGSLTGCMLKNWISGGSIYCFKDHMPPRYEGYVIAACDAKEMERPTALRRLVTLGAGGSDGFRKLPSDVVAAGRGRARERSRRFKSVAIGQLGTVQVEEDPVLRRYKRAATTHGVGGVVVKLDNKRQMTVSPGAILISDTIFVSGLPKDTDSAKLRSFFVSYGNIVEVLVSEQMGYVQFDAVESAEAVLDEDHVMSGCALEVHRAAKKPSPVVELPQVHAQSESNICARRDTNATTCCSPTSFGARV